MTHVGPGGEADFNALAAYLQAELARSDAETRAVRLASEASFSQWAHSVLEAIAADLGLAIGYLVGFIGGLYESAKTGFTGGFREGLKRGRGEA